MRSLSRITKKRMVKNMEPEVKLSLKLGFNGVFLGIVGLAAQRICSGMLSFKYKYFRGAILKFFKLPHYSKIKIWVII